MMWGPIGPMVRPTRPDGICRCTCYCREPATVIAQVGAHVWSVCEGCKVELEEAAVPW